MYARLSCDLVPARSPMLDRCPGLLAARHIGADLVGSRLIQAVTYPGARRFDTHSLSTPFFAVLNVKLKFTF